MQTIQLPDNCKIPLKDLFSFFGQYGLTLRYKDDNYTAVPLELPKSTHLINALELEKE